MFDELPLNCSHCNALQMVDILHLDTRPVSKTMTLRGYTCKTCGEWETVSVETAAMIDLLARIDKAKVGSTRYQMLMAKALEKQMNLVKKVKAESLYDQS